jgi:amino-acid N-acetyltransferase
MSKDMQESEEFIIRSARLDDAEKIFGLINEHLDDLVPRSLGNIVERIDRFIVAEKDGELIGCATYQVFPEIGAPIHSTVELQSVAVRSSFRHKGIGRKLILELIERVKKFNASAAFVLTFAPGFFSSLGFHEIPKQQVMYKLYTGCINCTKHTNPFTCPEKAMVKELV